jgi:hypothetical protein
MHSRQLRLPGFPMARSGIQGASESRLLRAIHRKFMRIGNVLQLDASA